jgi:methenyltetrahydromethanopterin cyclohydrolase
MLVALYALILRSSIVTLFKNTPVMTNKSFGKPIVDQFDDYHYQFYHVQCSLTQKKKAIVYEAYPEKANRSVFL